MQSPVKIPSGCRAVLAAAALTLFADAGNMVAPAAARSGWVREAFRAAHPCPSTGATRGPCPGYVVDHEEPLCFGGADRRENMRWQARNMAREKDRLEKAVCRAMKAP